jgi:aminoglycoside phosphotransferase family enzyme/predicted kinase
VREIELNAPHAPEIYEETVAITREADGRLAIGGKGTILDWAIRMRRFEQEDILSNAVAKAPLSPKLAADLAAMVAQVHRMAPVARKIGGPDIVQALVQQLTSELASASAIVSADEALAFGVRARESLWSVAALLQKRASAGAIRRCHGDLHLGNITLIEGRPVPFDALEFDEDLATIDVLYDLAFLLMDLEFRGDRRAANRVLNAYIGAAPVGGEIEGLACLPLFLACRASVRAVVAAERARQQQQGNERQAQEIEARRHLACALGYLTPRPPSLIAIGGLSGTGKSTLAFGLAPGLRPAPGALVVRSDVERKHLFGVAEHEPLSADKYTPEVTEQVYGLVERKCRQALEAGHSAVADAVFAKLEERQAIEALAVGLGAPFLGLWLEAPTAALISRLEARRGDASDAGPSVLMQQLNFDTGPIAWSRIDAGETPDGVLSQARMRLEDLEAFEPEPSHG